MEVVVDGAGGGLGQHLLQLEELCGANGLDGAEPLQKQPLAGLACERLAERVCFWWW